MLPGTSTPPSTLWTTRRSQPASSTRSRPMWRHQVVPGEVRAAQAWARLVGVDLGTVGGATQGPGPQVAAAADGPPAGRPRRRRLQLRRRLRLHVRRLVLRLQQRLHSLAKRLLP